jgi:DNA-directed RNA polymerase specialized sigma24 family protein
LSPKAIPIKGWAGFASTCIKGGKGTQFAPFNILTASPSEVMADSLTPKAWAKFIRHLAEDEGQAGLEYERLRYLAIKFFAWRGCPDPIHLANITLDRVIRRYGEGVDIVNLNGYVRGVAVHVYQEWLQGPVETGELPEDLPAEEGEEDEDGTDELKMACMKECIAALPPEDRNLLHEFFDGCGRARARSREELARRTNLTRSGLGTLIHRIRKQLKKCRDKCLQRLAATR